MPVIVCKPGDSHRSLSGMTGVNGRESFSLLEFVLFAASRANFLIFWLRLRFLAIVVIISAATDLAAVSAILSSLNVGQTDVGIRRKSRKMSVNDLVKQTNNLAALAKRRDNLCRAC